MHKMETITIGKIGMKRKNGGKGGKNSLPASTYNETSVHSRGIKAPFYKFTGESLSVSITQIQTKSVKDDNSLLRPPLF